MNLQLRQESRVTAAYTLRMMQSRNLVKIGFDNVILVLHIYFDQFARRVQAK